MPKLVLCEKPSVARDLARALSVPSRGDAFVSDELVITFCIGHLVELEEPAAYTAAWRRWSWDSLPMLPERFRLRPIKQTAKQWQVVRNLLSQKDFDCVVNACDAGREGELIFRFCYELAGCRLPILRLWISSLTPQAIKRGFAELHPGRDYDALAAAARCRAESDWLVGLNATRAVTLWRGGKQLLSIGRVQTPTLSLMVSRELEIQRFIPRDYFEVKAHLYTDGKDASFVAHFEHEGKRRFAAAAPAEAVASRDGAAAPPWVESIEEKPVREPPPLLFDLGSLQRTCNRRFGWSAQHTLSLAQSLYERHKLLTYPRTDSRYLSHDLIPQLDKMFAALARHPAYAGFCATLKHSELGAPRRIFQDHKVTDHHAIVPTLVEQTPERLEALSGPERQLLDLVARRFLGAFFPDAEFRETRAVVRVDAAAATAQKTAAEAAKQKPNPDGEYLETCPPPPDRYVARGRVRVRAGWQEVAGFPDATGERAEGSESAESSEDDKEDKAQALPPLKTGMRLQGEFTAVAKQTRPPPRYSEANLLAAMEGAGKQLSDEKLRRAMKDHGLGTAATRAAIIETLLDRGYVSRRGKLLVPTELGLDLIGSLPVPGLCSPELTGQWEARLSRLARGEEGAPAFMADIAGYVGELVKAVRTASPLPALSAPPPSQARSFGRTKAAAKAATKAPAKAPGRRASPRVSRSRKEGPEGPEAVLASRRSARSSVSPKKQGPATARRRKAPLVPKEPAQLCQPAAAPRCPPGTPVDPPIVCPRCHEARLLWGRNAWGCANFRECSLVIPYDLDGHRLSETELRALCTALGAAQAVTVLPGAASVRQR
jgi:DNA topoisomerase-3